MDMGVNGEVTIRLMRAGEEQAVHDLISRVFAEHVAPAYSQEGIDSFNSFLTLDFLRETGPEKFTLVAERGDSHSLAGILAVLNVNHIALLFVDSALQRCGMGGELINRCAAECLARRPGLDCLTVHASPNAVGFYEKMGFVPTGPEKNEQGMRFTPMKMNLTDKR